MAGSSLEDRGILGWLITEIEKVEPYSTDQLNDIPPEDVLGIESDTGLRLKALHVKSRTEPMFADKKTCELVRHLLEKLILAERRMNLGAKGYGVERFELYRGGKIGENKRQSSP